MNFFRIILVVSFAVVLSAPCAVLRAEEMTEDKISYKTNIEAEDVAVKGKIFFSDYYSMGGEKCAAFLEAEDGTLFCILDTMKSNDLKSEMGWSAGRVVVKGNMVEDSNGRYLKVEEYDVKDNKGTHKDSTTKNTQDMN